MTSQRSQALQQIININMQRKKSDIVDSGLSSFPQNCNHLFNQNRDNDSHSQPNHQTFFMKYASSIIQVVNEQKLQQLNPHAASGEQKSLIYEISEVNSYQTEMLPKGSQGKPVLSNNYNTLGQGFKKKTNKKHILTYNFTNITLFMNHITKIKRSILKDALTCFKNVNKKPKPINNQPPKSKSSFHSDYTASTTNQDNGPKKLIGLHLQLKRNQEFKEGFNTIKGWIQFRLLIIKSQAFRRIQSFFKCKESDLKYSKIRASSEFDLYFAKDEVLSLINQEEQSLAYTADHNFQFSQKQINVSTPEKTSIQQRMNIFTLKKDSKIAISINGTPNNHQSVVEVYKLSGVQPKKFQQNFKPKKCQVEPISLNIPKERKHLILRTNTFQLPLISQFYLKNEQLPKHNQISLKKDTFQQIENQISQWNDQILKQFQGCKRYFNEKKSLKKSQLKSKINVSQDKFSKFIIQSPNSINTQLHTEKSTQKFQINKQQFANTNQQKKGPHKVEEYYFPGLQSKIDRLIQSKSRIRNIADNKSINEAEKINLPVSHQRQSNPLSKNIRIQESLVRDFAFQNQNEEVANNQKNQMIVNKQKKVSFNLAPQQKVQTKLRQKPHVAFNSPQQRIATSPQNIHLNPIGSNQIKKKVFFSPPSTMRHFDRYESPKNNLVSKPNMQQEYNTIRPSEKQYFRHSNKEKQIQQIKNNIYQLNFPTHQPKTITNNAPNFYQKIDNSKNQNIKMTKQIIQPANCKVIPQNIVNRPGSRMAPSPPHLQLNYPIKTEQMTYGLTLNRQNSHNKVSFHSPEAQRNSRPQILYHQEAKHQQQILSSKRQHYNQQYFVTQNYVSKPQEKTYLFNKYYNNGINIPPRTNQMISPIVMPTNPYPDSKQRRTFGSQRPHSSFRQSIERFNIFSNNSPLESQIEHIQRSNNFTSRNSSQISRPKSMNEKILVTMRRQH